MRQFLKLLAQWLSTEHGVCFVLMVGAALLAITPLLLEGALPIDLPEDIAAPRPGTAVTAEQTEAYSAFETFRAYRYMRAIARDEGAVLWNPNDYTGVPFLAEWRTRALSPFSLPFYVFDLRSAFILSAFAKVFVAALLAFYVARVLGLTQAFATFVAVGHGLSAGLLVWTTDAAADAAPWIPLLFLFAERLSLGQVRYWPSGALVIGLMLLSGALQAFASAVVFFAIYAFLRRPHRQGSSGLAIGLSAVAAVLLGLALAAVQLVPYEEWFRESSRAWTSREASMGLGALASLIAPLGRDFGARAAAMLHVGLVPIFLSGLWPALRPYVPAAHQRRVDAVLILGWSWLGVGAVLGVLQAYAPPLQYVLLHEWLVPCGFAVALGAAATAEAWLQLRPEQSLATVRRYAVILAGLLIAAGLGYAGAFAFMNPPDADFLRAVVVGGVVVLMLVFVLAVTLVRPWTRFMGYTLALATALQLAVFLAPLQPHTSWEIVQARNAPLGAPDASGDRLASGTSANGTAAALSGHPLVRGYGRRIPKRMASFLERAATEPELFARAGAGSFLLSGDDLCGAFAPLRPDLRIETIVTGATARFDYLHSSERARMVHEVQQTDRFDPSGLRADRPPLVEGSVEVRAVEGWPGRALLEDPFSPTRFSVNVYRADPGLLVLADTNYPGWQARVDGSPARIYAVDGTFRGVEVLSGAREVEFRYAPPAFAWARIISFGSLSICLFGLAHLIYFRFRNQYFRM